MPRALGSLLPRLVVLRVTSRRYRRILIACLASLSVSATVLGAVVFIRWRAERAVRGDTRVLLQQAGEQLLRALQSRRGTLTLLRDVVDRTPGLTAVQQKALADSAAAHTRHLLGVGLADAAPALTWWSAPSLARGDLSAVARAVRQRTALPQAWRVPSTLTLDLPSGTAALIMLEPLRAPANRQRALIGLFALTPLLGDFFELSLKQPYPVQLLDGTQTRYRSTDWHANAPGTEILDKTLRIDGMQWTLHMQPGATHVVQTMSTFQKVVITFGLLSGGSTILLIWLLSMRTWILQRAVSRRTAALRRTTERLRQLATTDELTGLSNRRFFLERWQWECERAVRYKRPLACLMIDVNQFKRINDQLGHPMGDTLLKQVSQELKIHLRQSDVLARFGGDEFIVALPETSLEQATSVAEKLRQVEIAGPWSAQARIGPVRVSVGVSHVQSRESVRDAIQRADASLYESRRRSHAAHPSAAEAALAPSARSEGPPT